jgi:hypothetical protein
MSGAFVRESDDQWLQDVGPSLNALVNFLTRENNGVRVNLLRTEPGQDGRALYFMSNGLAYYKNQKGIWTVFEK